MHPSTEGVNLIKRSLPRHHHHYHDTHAATPSPSQRPSSHSTKHAQKTSPKYLQEHPAFFSFPKLSCPNSSLDPQKISPVTPFSSSNSRHIPPLLPELLVRSGFYTPRRMRQRLNMLHQAVRRLPEGHCNEEQQQEKQEWEEEEQEGTELKENKKEEEEEDKGRNVKGKT
ncbi:hypothetical protein E2C01_051472 [Portunus trituberculatus]|uniref:Uncharacterized protein n=1 Tax=Portunus trituberculatus TaxID=210409 RepID=A0A5B7GBP6_PORTR|nr:hypothetical protein [Portunus trituberculatus]